MDYRTSQRMIAGVTRAVFTLEMLNQMIDMLKQKKLEEIEETDAADRGSSSGQGGWFPGNREVSRF